MCKYFFAENNVQAVTNSCLHLQFPIAESFVWKEIVCFLWTQLSLFSLNGWVSPFGLPSCAEQHEGCLTCSLILTWVYLQLFSQSECSGCSSLARMCCRQGVWHCCRVELGCALAGGLKCERHFPWTIKYLSVASMKLSSFGNSQWSLLTSCVKFSVV